MQPTSLIQLPTRAELAALDPRWVAHQARMGKFPLHHIAYALNRACELWLKGNDAPARAAPRGSFLRELKPPNFAFIWAATECLKHALLWSPPYEFESKLAPQVLKLHEAWAAIAYAVDRQIDVPISRLEQLAKNGVEAVVYALFAPQHAMERSSGLRVGQALAMFRDAPRRRAKRDSTFPLAAFEDVVEGALGMPLERFAMVVALLNVRALDRDPRINASRGFMRTRSHANVWS